MTTPQRDEPGTDQATEPTAAADQGDGPTPPGGDDVRIGPEQSDEPQAGATEPTD
ncbi:hypothetical protein AB0J80_29175 [Actinoplanes sp. NPDC049548]|uniref:hypothetical protein n=1 Tax=Actinoplanes sp. NPDC049548 TaxID=3155152 RepID=UPI00343DB7A5